MFYFGHVCIVWSIPSNRMLTSLCLSWATFQKLLGVAIAKAESFKVVLEQKVWIRWDVLKMK